MVTEVTAKGSTPADDFETGGSRLHETALFNPVKKVREKAWKQIRAQSPFGPETWDALDREVGVKGEKAELTADATLTVDSWQEYADVILDDRFVESNIVDTLIGAGFGVSTSLFRYAYFDRLRATRLEADRSMNARSRSTQEMPSHGLHGVPLWIHHVDYEFDSREFQNAQQFGDDLDTSVGQEARRALNRSEHDMLWNGEGRNIQTDRGTLSVLGLDSSDSDFIIQGSSNSGWINDAVEILDDIDAMQGDIENQTDVIDEDDVPLVSEIGAWLMVPRERWGDMTREDYETSATDEPLIDRINRKYDFLNIVPAPRLDADSAILMLDDTRYFQIVTAQGVTNTNWEVDGGFGLRNKTLSSRTPFVRKTPDNIRGIVRYTGIDA